MTVQVIAMGGYEIAEPFGSPSALERYLFEAAGLPKPRVCFLGTAQGDAPDTIARFCETLPCIPTHLARFHDRDVDDLDAFFDVCDIVYVAGGNTASMLAVERGHPSPDAGRLRPGVTRTSIPNKPPQPRPPGRSEVAARRI